MKMKKWIRTALALTIVALMLAPAISGLPFNLLSFGVLDVSANAAPSLNSNIPVTWSTGYQYESNYLTLQNASTLVPDFKHDQYFTYEAYAVGATSSTTNDVTKSTATIQYNLDGNTETFTLTNLRSTASSDLVYLKLTAKKTVTVNVSMACTKVSNYAKVYRYYCTNDSRTYPIFEYVF